MRRQITHVVRTIVRMIGAVLVLLIAVVLVGPLTYDGQAHVALNESVRQYYPWGNQIFGLDLTSPRQNIFSLARDFDHTITIIDHSHVYSSHLLALTQWLRRGAMYTVADALKWFDVSLTARQARLIKLCSPLEDLAEDTPIVIQPDPWQSGIASWYGPGFDGRMAASGEIYRQDEPTAAHKTLPMGSIVRVVARRTGQSIVIRINDRGPYIAGRIIDLSYRSKELLGMGDLAAVYLERIDPTALDVSCR